MTLTPMLVICALDTGCVTRDGTTLGIVTQAEHDYILDPTTGPVA